MYLIDKMLSMKDNKKFQFDNLQITSEKMEAAIKILSKIHFDILHLFESYNHNIKNQNSILDENDKNY